MYKSALSEKNDNQGLNCYLFVPYQISTNSGTHVIALKIQGQPHLGAV